MDKDGTIWIHDHDFGGLSQLASSFEEYVRVHCLKLSDKEPNRTSGSGENP
jgi:hypothetical protein